MRCLRLKKIEYLGMKLYEIIKLQFEYFRPKFFSRNILSLITILVVALSCSCGSKGGFSSEQSAQDHVDEYFMEQVGDSSCGFDDFLEYVEVGGFENSGSMEVAKKDSAYLIVYSGANYSEFSEEVVSALEQYNLTTLDYRWKEIFVKQLLGHEPVGFPLLVVRDSAGVTKEYLGRKQIKEFALQDSGM